MARASRRLGERVIKALAASPLFVSAAIPKHIFPPLFNRYGVGAAFRRACRQCGAGRSADRDANSNRSVGDPVLSDPEEYDGGELVVEDYYGSHEVKLAAGDLVLYPATSLHTVPAITRGTRVASFFWLQSMIRDAHARSMDFRSRCGDPGPRRADRARRSRHRQADRHLSQSDPVLGRSLKRLQMISERKTAMRASVLLLSSTGATSAAGAAACGAGDRRQSHAPRSTTARSRRQRLPRRLPRHIPPPPGAAAPPSRRDARGGTPGHNSGRGSSARIVAVVDVSRPPITSSRR